MVKITGGKRHAAKLRALVGSGMEREVGAALFAAGNAIQVDAQISITTGAVSGKGHVPSAPGQAPNADTHRLADNIETVLLPDEADVVRVEVSSNAPYSAALEFGTSKMAARPFMAPAAEKNRENVARAVLKAVNKVQVRSGK